MLGGSIIKCLDKQVPTVLCQLFHQSHILRKKKSVIKSRSPLLTFQNHFTNILNSILEKQIVWGPHAEIKQYLEDNNCGTTSVTETLTNLLQITRKQSRKIASKYPIFKDISKKTIVENFEILKRAGVSFPLIQNNVILLTDNCHELKKKINTLQNFVDDIDDAISLLYHDTSSLNYFTTSNDIMTELKSVQQQLQHQVTNKELYDFISKYFYYVVHHPKDTMHKIKLLLDHGITVNSLIYYDWPMDCDYDTMEVRVKQCYEAGLLMKTPSFLTCNEEYFKRKIQTNKRYKLKLDEYTQLIDFLSEKSGYSTKVIRYLLHFKGVKKEKLPNLKETKKIINIFLTKNYNYHDIIWSIKVLTLSENFIAHRFSVLQDVKHKAPFLNVLLLSDEAFEKYVNSKK